MKITHAISIRQPWAWLIVNGYKDIENRTWATKFRGGIAIHASKKCTRKEYQAAGAWMIWNMGHPLRCAVPSLEDLERGGIVGLATITDCVQKSKSSWFTGEYGFVLKNRLAIEFTPYKGQLGIFKLKEPITL